MDKAHSLLIHRQTPRQAYSIRQHAGIPQLPRIQDRLAVRKQYVPFGFLLILPATGNRVVCSAVPLLESFLLEFELLWSDVLYRFVTSIYKRIHMS